ncbi:hypothetical protein BGZ67_003911 [Mortierella alpina]|nr:hypothetical protein BGZ67_003911 [Mortierella alpina]
MFKSCILVGLAFAFGAVSAVGNETANAFNKAEVDLNFYTAWYNEGDPTYCLNFKFDQCYTLTNRIIAGGLSSARFNNYDFWVRRFTITVYSGSNCNYAYDRWSFTTTQHTSYIINQFPTLNDNVRSFKVANFHTSTDSGNIGAKPEEAAMTTCFQK